MTLYVLHPGYVNSKNDGDRHYVGVMRLVSLYGLWRHDWIESQPGLRLDEEARKVVHLYPRNDGNYQHV